MHQQPVEVAHRHLAQDDPSHCQNPPPYPQIVVLPPERVGQERRDVSTLCRLYLCQFPLDCCAAVDGGRGGGGGGEGGCGCGCAWVCDEDTLSVMLWRVLVVKRGVGRLLRSYGGAAERAGLRQPETRRRAGEVEGSWE